MKKFIAVILSISIIFAFTACGSESKEEAVTAPDVESFTISTDYCDLKYPSQWEKDVDVDVDGGVVKFKSGDTKLFNLYFNSNKGQMIGSFTNDKKDVTLSIKSFDIKESVKNYEDKCCMKEDVNILLQFLQADYGFKFGGEEVVAPEEENTATIDIETSKATLKYPEKYKDKTDIDVKEDKVVFKHGDTHLFTIYYGGDKGNLLGTYDEIDIRVITNNKAKEEELIMIDEGVNTILQNLMEDKKFKVHTEN